MKENQELEATDIAEQEIDNYLIAKAKIIESSKIKNKQESEKLDCWLYIKKNKKNKVTVKCIKTR